MPEDNGYGDYRDTCEEMRVEIERERYDMADWEPDEDELERARARRLRRESARKDEADA
jgi:hypothetical protein